MLGPLVAFYLDEYLRNWAINPVEVYVDESKEAGTPPEEELREKIRFATCIVPVFCGPYFYGEGSWCPWELAHFLVRGKDNHRYVVPLCLNPPGNLDVYPFPARGFNPISLADFARIPFVSRIENRNGVLEFMRSAKSRKFKTSRVGIQFDNVVRESLVPRVVRAVSTPPPWDPARHRDPPEGFVTALRGKPVGTDRPPNLGGGNSR